MYSLSYRLLSANLQERWDRKDEGREDEGRMSLLKVELKQLETKQGVRFRTGFMNLGAKKLMTADALMLMRGDKMTWKIDNRLYLTHQFDKIFEFMTECKAEILLLNDNLHASILKELSNVAFWELKELSLSKNNLTSIENLIGLNMPKLAKLDISNNQITSVRSLNHLTTPISSLKLNDNPIADVEKLARSSFNQLIQLDLQTKSKCTVIGESLVWLMRQPSSLLSQLRCASRKRIKEEWLYHQLAKKYPKGRISLH